MSTSYTYTTLKVNNMIDLYDILVQICEFFNVKNIDEVINTTYEKIQNKHLHIYTDYQTKHNSTSINESIVESDFTPEIISSGDFAKVDVRILFKDLTNPFSYTIYIDMILVKERSDTLVNTLNVYPGLTLDTSREIPHTKIDKYVKEICVVCRELVENNHELTN